MTPIQFEQTILKPLLLKIAGDCLAQGHKLPKYGFRITVDDQTKTFCYACEKQWSEDMQRLAAFYLDE